MSKGKAEEIEGRRVKEKLDGRREDRKGQEPKKRTGEGNLMERKGRKREETKGRRGKGT